MSARRRTAGLVGPPVAALGRCDATGKVRYDSQHAAAKSRSARRNKGARMRAYLCEACHGWHLTTQGTPTDRFRKPKT